MMATKELAKQYDPFAVEAKWVEKWANEPFRADATSDKPPFCIDAPSGKRSSPGSKPSIL